MSSGNALDSTEASVARVTVENHPLATCAMTVEMGSPPESRSPPRSQRTAIESQSPPPTNPTVATTTPASNRPNKTSGVVTDVSPSSKSLDELADEFLSSKPPPVLLRPDPLPRGEVGILRLRTLVERRAWGDVLKLASSLLDGSSKKKSASKNKRYAEVYASLLTSGQDDAQLNYDLIPENSLQETAEIITLRCNALLKLRRYNDLSREVEQWKFLKQNDIKAPSVEWLPWGIHILAGQSHEYSSESKQAADILRYLREEIPSDDFGWLASLDNALANVYIRSGEWRLALGCFDSIRDLIPEVAEAEVRSLLASNDDNAAANREGEEMMRSLLAKSYTCEILSRQGRIFLQIGALPAAKDCFYSARTVWAEIESSTSSSNVVPANFSSREKTLRVAMPSLLRINDGLLEFSLSNYDGALKFFSNVIDILRENGTTLQSQYRTQDWLGPGFAGCEEPSVLYNDAVNNAALCNLYMCRLGDAVASLEAVVREDPAAFLTERVAFNLCTLYELGCDSSVATRKKQVLQLIAKRFFLHDIGPESFRVG
eukprot:CAMPEP_0197190632 /NCGR_PEP_ID=MMETSP1423-20130617/22031_1 /TAXON_ID=476441 /ORGANISM="Pseudo-nitzschia heimii, Strain UNC1101" /LENGTH=544 /DNA_ID=CAMNT_0042643057 /DNA_START=20 /DNA_END=1654 /DNA_ORIENTATION=+